MYYVEPYSTEWRAKARIADVLAEAAAARLVRQTEVQVRPVGSRRPWRLALGRLASSLGYAPA
jgi:hypothetical protein